MLSISINDLRGSVGRVHAKRTTITQVLLTRRGAENHTCRVPHDLRGLGHFQGVYPSSLLRPNPKPLNPEKPVRKEPKSGLAELRLKEGQYLQLSFRASS